MDKNLNTKHSLTAHSSWMLSQSPSINSFIHSSVHLSVHSIIYRGAQEQFPHSTSSPVPATYFPIPRSLPSREGPTGTYHTVWTKWRMKETISKSHQSQQHYALMTGCLPEVLACSPGNTHLATFTLPGFAVTSSLSSEWPILLGIFMDILQRCGHFPRTIGNFQKGASCNGPRQKSVMYLPDFLESCCLLEWSKVYNGW